MQEHTFKVHESLPVRLDIYLVECFANAGLTFSRAFIQKLIRQGNVTVDGDITRPHQKIKKGEIIKIVIPPEPDQKPQAENIPLEVVYEDGDLLLINKPRGLVVHPAAGNLSGTLVNALLSCCQQLSSVNPDRPGIVHRLDKDTAGLLVVAKNNAAHLNLTRQFARHSIKRVYIALVSGRVEFDEGVVDLPVGRHPIARKKMAVNFKDRSRKALTRYRVLKRYNRPSASAKGGSNSGKDFTVMELIPQTGRTHQLRVHMAALDHPILGDATYGQKDESIPEAGCALKLALYAKCLGFNHPKTDKYIEFEHPLPADMQNILDRTQLVR